MYSLHRDSIISLVLPFVYLFSSSIIILYVYKKIGLVGVGTFCATNHCFYQGNLTFELKNINQRLKYCFVFSLL